MKILVVYAHPNPHSFCHAVLERLSAGLKDAGHTFEVVDLYASHFNPVFGVRDFAGFIHENMPAEVLERMNLRKHILDSCRNPIERFVASRWLKGKDSKALARFIRSQMPRDILEQQEKITWADGLVFIAPTYWLHFPAILKGWFERVFNYEFAFALTPEGWQGNAGGRIPLLHKEKALIITPTLFKEADYQKAGLEKAMHTIIDDWGLRYPGVRHVEHVYFYAVNQENGRDYLERAYRLGVEFANA